VYVIPVYSGKYSGKIPEWKKKKYIKIGKRYIRDTGIPALQL
jgi:hypothetical protein